MKEFILEEELEKITDNNTKSYLEEVISCYNSGSYRSAVVVLYTTIIYDLLKKITVLKNVYNDSKANEIIQNIQKKQKESQNKSEWEWALIEEICRTTKFITDVEKDILSELKKTRNYAAHPIIEIENDMEKIELMPITKETTKDLIRKAFDIVFLKDAILARKIEDEIIADLNDVYNRVRKDGLEKYLRTKYFYRMTQVRKDSLFRTLWKFVFKLDNSDVSKNREANYHGLIYLYNENPSHYYNLLKENNIHYFDIFKIETYPKWCEEKQYEQNINSLIYFNKVNPMLNFINYLQEFPQIYEIMTEHSQNNVLQSIKHMYLHQDAVLKEMYKAINKNEDEYLYRNQVILMSTCVFIQKDKIAHLADILKMVNNNMCGSAKWTNLERYCIFTNLNLHNIYRQYEHYGLGEICLNFIIEYCTNSKKFCQTEGLFDDMLEFKEQFTDEQYHLILKKMDENNQIQEYNGKELLLDKLKEAYEHKFSKLLI